MNNWKDIHEDFIPRLQQLWHNFTVEQVQKWISKGLTPTDYDLANYCQRKGHSPDDQTLNLEELRKEHQENLDFKDIIISFAEHDYGEWTDDGVTYYYEFWDGIDYQEAKLWIQEGFIPEDFYEVKQWIKFNFTAPQARAWTDVGLNKEDDAEFAAYLRDNGYTPATAFQEKGHVQTWLDWKYPQEQRDAVKELNLFFRHFTGSLNLSDFVNLKKLTCSYNKFQQDLSVFSHLVNLEVLDIDNNHFFGSLEPLQNLNKLKELDISNTDIDSGLEYLPESIKLFCCFATEGDKCQAIYDLFANEQGIVEAEEENYRLIKNFLQKFQEYKQKWEKDNPAKALELQKEKNKFLIPSYKKTINALEKQVKGLKEELQIEREEEAKSLEKAKEWRERQLKEITAQKDQQIEELKKQISQLQAQLITLKIGEQTTQILHNPPKTP